jgi:hypothetical protein
MNEIIMYKLYEPSLLSRTMYHSLYADALLVCEEYLFYLVQILVCCSAKNIIYFSARESLSVRWNELLVYYPSVC